MNKPTTWQKDSDIKVCQLKECSRGFSILVRKHHCRHCGRIFCQEHSSRKILLRMDNADFVVEDNPSAPAEQARVCDTCYSIYAKIKKDYNNGVHKPAEEPAVDPNEQPYRRRAGTIKSSVTTAMEEVLDLPNSVFTLPQQPDGVKLPQRIIVQQNQVDCAILLHEVMKSVGIINDVYLHIKSCDPIAGLQFLKDQKDGLDERREEIVEQQDLMVSLLDQVKNDQSSYYYLNTIFTKLQKIIDWLFILEYAVSTNERLLLSQPEANRSPSGSPNAKYNVSAKDSVKIAKSLLQKWNESDEKATPAVERELKEFEQYTQEKWNQSNAIANGIIPAEAREQGQAEKEAEIYQQALDIVREAFPEEPAPKVPLDDSSSSSSDYDDDDHTTTTTNNHTTPNKTTQRDSLTAMVPLPTSLGGMYQPESLKDDPFAGDDDDSVNSSDLETEGGASPRYGSPNTSFAAAKVPTLNLSPLGSHPDSESDSSSEDEKDGFSSVPL
eukprot:TRINITY_DN14065_c0_g1_i1.p1 TRINITY_DN14065_c0_g1~~TRINITY_DN14065_c0_g1_i1.p1  ORF type:complete len:496 (+),score=56.95 TRINITY_DN14065_c0_g1_i1:57-1544(+)